VRKHPRRAAVDATSPRAWGTSDRDGFINNLENMSWQFDWAGTSLVNKHILVAECELDTPQRQLGAIILPPDPPPIMNARPEPYAIDEESPGPYVAEDGVSTYVTEGSGVLATEYESSGN
jgi:hypothetical protein